MLFVLPVTVLLRPHTHPHRARGKEAAAAPERRGKCGENAPCLLHSSKCRFRSWVVRKRSYGCCFKHWGTPGEMREEQRQIRAARRAESFRHEMSRGWRFSLPATAVSASAVRFTSGHRAFHEVLFLLIVNFSVEFSLSRWLCYRKMSLLVFS